MSFTEKLSLRHVRTRPLAVLAAGLVLVALDFRTRSVDVLPDAAGWLLVGAGSWIAGVRRASLLAGGAALLSVAELTLPYHFVLYDAVDEEYTRIQDPPAGVAVLQRWDDLSQLRGAVIASAMVLGAAAAILLLRALAQRALADHDDSGARELRGAMLAPAIWSLAFVSVIATALMSGERYDPVWDGAGEAAWLIAVAALLGLAVFFVARRDRGWAFLAHTEAEAPSRGTAPSHS